MNQAPLFHSRYDPADPTRQIDSEAKDALIQTAEKIIVEPLYSIMDKTAPPAGGDKHHYTSLAKYWWPNPSKPDGLPYVRRDGRVNPEIEKYDVAAWSKTATSVKCLSRAAAITGRQDFANRAGEQMATWFLDDSTKMIPHLRYAQFVPGKFTGRSFGIIEWSCIFPRMLDEWSLISERAFSTDQTVAFNKWCSDLLDWLLESEFGREESRAMNNHSVYYDVLAVYLCLWLGRRDEAHTILKQVPEQRIDRQIEPDGRMPRELERTKSLSYTIMNTSGFCLLATLGEHIDIDLWSYQSHDGRSIRVALEFLNRHMRSREPWPYEQIEPVSYDKNALRLIQLAENAYGEPFDVATVAHRISSSPK